MRSSGVRSPDPFYKSARWERLRRQAMRRDGYICQQSKRYGRITSAEQKKERVKIDDLKKKLEASDHWLNKYFEGEYTEEEWQARKAQRKEWRARLRELQADFVEPTITQDEIRTAIDLAEQNLKKIIERETGKEVEEISLGEET